MNFFLSLFRTKLAALRAAAPRATLHMLNDGGAFCLYLDEATAARKVSKLGTLTDYAEDILEDSIPTLTIPLDQMVKFLEDVTAHHSVALIDVAPATKVMAARHTMFAYLPKKAAAVAESPPVEESDDFWG